MLRDNIFKKYPNKVFIETGSYLGNGIRNAIEAGFEQIYSIELSEKYFNYCKEQFVNYPQVIMVFGDSCERIKDVIKDIDTPITFWLDGHHSCEDTALGKYWTPLMQELEQIKGHKIKNHTIIIDDMRCWKEPNPVHGFYTPDILQKIQEINSNYEISYENGQTYNDILVAKIKE